MIKKKLMDIKKLQAEDMSGTLIEKSKNKIGNIFGKKNK